MPLPHYGVLKARAVERLEATSRSPHYQIHVVDQEGTDYRVAINVLSQVQPYNLLYHVNDQFNYPTLPDLLKLPDGFTPLPSKPNSLAIDFLRSNIVDADKMRPVLFTDIGSEPQLNDILEKHVQLALQDPDARIYAFGDHWSDGKPDQYFKITSGQGIHDIHMNQGNDAGHARDDGTWQDGALMISLPDQGRWLAVFLKFQSQANKTDDHGHAIGGSHGGDNHGGQHHEPGGHGHHHHHHGS